MKMVVCGTDSEQCQTKAEGVMVIEVVSVKSLVTDEPKVVIQTQCSHVVNFCLQHHLRP